MARPIFTEKEMEVIGSYPGLRSVKLMGIMGGIDDRITFPKRNRPITPYENWKLLLTGKKPYWIPRYGFVCGDDDIVGFRPRENSDNIANHQVFDGGDYYDYVGLGNIIYSAWFDLIWEFVPSCGGATVRPGEPRVKDMNQWRDIVKFPNLDEVDWEACAKRNREYTTSDKLVTLGIQCGIWERLISLMDCDKAAMAMIDEDQEDAVKDFFDALTDFYIDYIGRLKKACPGITNVLIHEDWCHQNGPFFSPDTAREMLVPYMNKLADFCHENGMFFEHHCCGKLGPMADVMVKEVRSDFWCGQQDLNDGLAMAKKYQDCNFAIGVQSPAVPDDATPEDIQKIADDFVAEYGDCKIIICDMTPIRPELLEALYRAYRIRFSDYDY